jgi:ABC-2 type transport system permease protein
MAGNASRAWLLFRVFARQNFQQQSVYRLNFVFAVLGKLLRIGFVVIFFQSLTRVADIPGWNGTALWVLAATFYLVDLAASVFFQRNLLYYLPEMIRTGQLDRILTKPVSPLALTAFHVIDVGDALAIAPLVVFWTGLAVGQGIELTIGRVAAYLGLVALALVLTFFLMLLLGSLSFWTVRGDGFGRFVDRLTTVAQFPLDLFPRAVRVLLFSVVPLALLATLPTQALFGRVAPVQIIAASVATVAIGGLALLAWHRGLQRYSSAST